ncbi:hypothetical protein LO771_11110 [Streptacidiphilus sp. ASG 303]|uniref:hypothetical protein n=1 Tax=Streptacidiphilus sp. ASG 303 TaxID=2896847 RepID=UPI001E57E450|nr:hypothetical protein [Streptacidiphilus sp. ASG 303]MCD0482933.1 hypothetical protein [Streptacidiphilus sp. ASG 303]
MTALGEPGGDPGPYGQSQGAGPPHYDWDVYYAQYLQEQRSGDGGPHQAAQVPYDPYGTWAAGGGAGPYDDATVQAPTVVQQLDPYAAGHHAADPYAAGPDAAGPEADGPADEDDDALPPRLSAGLKLHGEYRGSGFAEPRYIARRGDGQVVQLTRLLYLVACAVDGERDRERIAHRVSAEFGREVSADNIAYLLENKLQPLGITVPPGQDDDEVDAPRSDLLLSLKGHKVLFNERRVARISRSLSWLHRPVSVAAVLLTAVGLDVWFFGWFGAMTPVLHTLEQPVLLLVVLGLTIASMVFHEFGHASACRYGGAHPGCIGCGLYLIWPAMYTDVTDVYRLGRGGRIRTDLGGIYFNVVFILGLFGCYFLTGQQVFLAAAYLAHFEVLEQLMPALRLDGYYILGDLAGVPDLFGKIKPILVGMVPGRPVPRDVADLKKSSRVIVTAWVLMMVPLVVGELSYALWNLPRILSTAERSLVDQVAGTAAAFREGQVAESVLGVVGSVLLILPTCGIAYLVIRVGHRLIGAARKGTAGRPAARIGLLVGIGCVGAVLVGAWTHGLTPKPLPPRPPIVPALQPNLPPRPTPSAGPSTPAPSRRPGRSAVEQPTAPAAPSPSASATIPARRGSASPKASPSASASRPAPSASGSASAPPPGPGPSTPPPTPGPSTPAPTPTTPGPSTTPPPSPGPTTTPPDSTPPPSTPAPGPATS